MGNEINHQKLDKEITSSEKFDPKIDVKSGETIDSKSLWEKISNFFDFSNVSGLENESPDTSKYLSEATDINDKDSTVSEIEEKIKNLPELMKTHPEKNDLWDKLEKTIETLDAPESSPTEIRSAMATLSHIKGEIIELAAKDVLKEAGLVVESKQRVVEGENGGTRPDVIAVNNTDKLIQLFNSELKPGETLSIECKCGGSQYLENQLNNHIPNQLSGHEGKSVLLTTSDIHNVKDGLAESVCERYGTTLVNLDLSVSDIENSIKEVVNNDSVHN